MNDVALTNHRKEVLDKILQDIASKVHGGSDGGPIMGADGNKVGEWSLHSNEKDAGGTLSIKLSDFK